MSTEWQDDALKAAEEMAILRSKLLIEPKVWPSWDEVPEGMTVVSRDGVEFVKRGGDPGLDQSLAPFAEVV